MVFRALFLVLIALAASSGIARGAANAGGTLVIHALSGEYSGGGLFCGVDPIADCSSASTTVPNSPEPRVFSVYAAFSDKNEPDLMGVEFGLTYDRDVHILSYGHCAEFEDSQPGWPSSGTGTRIIWFEGQPDRLIQIYWFAAYSYAPESSTFDLGPHPETGGHFADGSVIPILDQINDYGSIGFGEAGHLPCPEPGHYYVTDEGGTEYLTIQSALDIAGPGSVIELADGIYRGEGNRDLNFNSTALTVRSGSGNPENCIIDCEGSSSNNRRGVYVGTGHDADSRLEGVTITNGWAGSQFGFNAEGGGVKMSGSSRFTLSNCIVENCVSEVAGGGVDAEGFLEMNGCIVRNNSISGVSGAGLSAGQTTVKIVDCLFENNMAHAWGGGLRFTNCELEVENSQFFGNVGTTGGGIALSFTNATFDGCTWAANEGTEGGALHCIGGSAFLNNCTITNNDASLGSGIFTRSQTDLRIQNSIISFGTGGSAIYCGGPVEVSSTDIFGNSGGDWITCLADQLGVDQNFSADPLFCNPTEQDFTLDSASPCTQLTGLGSDPIGAWPVACGNDPANIPPPQAGDWTLDSANISRVSPNPFSVMTEIHYTVPDSRPNAAGLRISIFDTTGRRIRHLESAPATPGTNIVSWDGRRDDGTRVATGVFYAQLEVQGREDVVRLTVLR